MTVRIGGRDTRVDLVRPINLSGDRRRHRTQVREVAEEAISSAIAVSGVE